MDCCRQVASGPVPNKIPHGTEASGLAKFDFFVGGSVAPGGDVQCSVECRAPGEGEGIAESLGRI